MKLAQTYQDLMLLAKDTFKSKKVSKTDTNLPVGDTDRKTTVHAAMGNIKHDADLQKVIDAGKVSEDRIGYVWYKAASGLTIWLARFEVDSTKDISLVFLPDVYHGLYGYDHLPCEDL